MGPTPAATNTAKTNLAPNKTSSTKRKARTEELKSRVAVLEARVATLEAAQVESLATIDKLSADLSKSNQDLFFKRAVYKQLCHLFFKSAVHDYTDPKLHEALNPSPGGGHGRNTHLAPPVNTAAESAAGKEFRKILAAATRAKLGLIPKRPDNEPEPDV
jgi:hypothetical protein